ncbi:MAG: hypothetical protein O7E52_27880 [Candidatus Poribacteria bacterium]|nr:hypothetical protein [Candidatus Poribacteria bacterium]
MAIHIYADFNNCEENGKVRLNTNGSLSDLSEVNDKIHPDMSVWLYDEEFEVEAKLEYNQKWKIWLGAPNWSTIRYFNDSLPIHASD